MSIKRKIMSHEILISKTTDNIFSPRIGGGALIGGIIDWPRSPNGQLLTLIASIPNTFITNNTELKLSKDLYTSVFSYYSEVDYFLDQITYHGDPDELSGLMQGATKVMQHPAGEIIHGKTEIPQHLLEIGDVILSDDDCGSRIGGNPCILQNETLKTDDLKFSLQFRSSDFPGKFSDVFGVLDALGYLFLKENSQLSDMDGLFFVQTT
jgi:hypothetical protein